jgi:two-component system response regulator RegX3
VLDVMLPGLDGLEVCRRIQAQRPVPVLLLTARDDETDMLVGLGVGADDYMTKPFSMRELVARMRAVLRRGQQAQTAPRESAMEVNGVRLDPERYEVAVRGTPVELPPKEFALLEVLIRNAGRVLTRDMLIERVWGVNYVGDTKTLDVHIKRLRGRLERDPREPELILTIRGVGYKLAD